MMARQFIRAKIVELLPDVWSVVATYSYYNLYEFTESHIATTRNGAMLWLLEQRCEGRLSVVDIHGVNVDYTTAS